jgi:rare lipoprotein A
MMTTVSCSQTPRVPARAPSASAPARAPERPTTPTPARRSPALDRQSGQASYYSDRLAGHATASGEPYDPTRLTAAHRTLPLGSLVAVTRDDGRRVEVRINDRGPFGASRRIIDLSRSAAAALGMIEAGVIDVQVEVLEVPQRKATRTRKRRRVD